MTAVDYQRPGVALGEEAVPGGPGQPRRAAPGNPRFPSRERLDDGTPPPLHALLEDYRFLAARHVPLDVIAARLGMPVDTLQTILRRHGDEGEAPSRERT